MHVKADTDKCVGAGQCVLVAAAVFDQRETDGIVELLQPEPPGETHDAVREAALLCPTHAIQVEE
ncbi:ferredoxin [Stackebrandtia nassauensis]|uniref:Ferredoxin n=1 Tax=Stackebrandtia nassauensis (strain DSM 44728 / CIP 108903 / NRRL B-16338 / NBRC 102104 / LLR-40K-21) TaxID=446470 RepID=D3Q7E4_STANL|nr:ferredoxin [Stackebrandtia nassauensis]ADD42415.1 protein of unknown function DUF1271 [Stackebrandtia nassauensis DSM 44728]